MTKLLSILLLCVGVVCAGRKCLLHAFPFPTPFCGERGLVDPKSYISPLNISFTECAVLTNTLLPDKFFGEYAYFSYDDENKICTIYMSYAWDIYFQPSKDGPQFFDSGCFVCVPDCVDPPYRNVLFNSNFTYSDTSVWPFQPTENWDIRPGLRTDRVIACDGQSDEGCFLYANFYTCRSQLYLFKISYYFITNDYSPSPVFLDIGSSSLYFNEDFDQPFRTLYFSFHPDQLVSFDSILFLDFFGYREDTIVSMESIKAVPQISAIPIKAGAPNLIENGGFETGSLKPWVARCNYDYYELYSELQSHDNNLEYQVQKSCWCQSRHSVTTPGFYSNYAFTFQRPQGRCKAPRGAGIQLKSGSFSTTPGVTYLFAFDFYGNLRRISARVKIDGLALWEPSAFISEHPSQTMFQSIPDSPGWHRFERVVTVSVNETRIYLDFVHLRKPKAEDLYIIDNLSFTEVDLDALEASLSGASQTPKERAEVKGNNFLQSQEQLRDGANRVKPRSR